MGKNHRHKKQLKSERSKVKLKSKLLPKGTNITNTTFKIKKIVIREQLRDKSLSDVNLATKVKEVISRLHHHNHKALLDAINETKSLLESNFYFVYIHHVGPLMQSLAHLSLHEEKDVRRECFKVLFTFLSAIVEYKHNENNVKPFFDTLSSYLCCAMTHINPRIKEDSLLFLDVLLNSVPSLVVASSTKIFNNFLDFISKLRQGSKSRNLTLNLNSGLTSLKWRMKVFERLVNMLKFIVTNNFKTKSLEGYDNIFNTSKHVIPYFYDQTKNLVEADIICSPKKPEFFGYGRDSNSSNDLNNIDKLKEYIEVVLPLLFDTWMEIRPSTESNVQHNMRTNLNTDQNDLMFTLLEIIVLLWNYVQNMESNSKIKEISHWFVRQFSKPFNEILMEQFPYSNSDDKNGERSSRKALNCDINQLIAYLGVIFNPEPKNNIICQKILHHLQKLFQCIQAGQKFHHRETVYICIISKLILIDVSNKWKHHVSLENLLSAIVNVIQKSGRESSETYLRILMIQIAQSPELDYLHTYPKFNDWMESLPYLLTTNISKPELLQLCSITNQRNKFFLQALKETLPLISDKLTVDIKTTDDAQYFACLFKQVSSLLSNEEVNTILTSVFKNCNERISAYLFSIILD